MPDNQRKTEPRKKSPYRTVIWIIVVIVLIYIAIPNRLRQRRYAWEPRAKSTLRSIGSSQLAYQGANDLKSYGSIQALQDSLWIAEGYSPGNMIENYSMTWEISSSSVVQTEGPVKSDRFTIIAFPRDTREGYLNTFGIAEDQIIRVYTPDNDFDRVKTWEPIL